jgi:hypothetical protein
MLLQKLSGALAPALGALASGGDVVNNELALAGLASAVRTIAADEQLLRTVCQKFCSRTRVSIDGSNYFLMTFPGTGALDRGFDEVFLGAMDCVYDFIRLHLQMNYADFLGKISNALRDAAPSPNKMKA